MDDSVSRVLINRGDILFIRNDVPHCGSENLSGITHHRVYVNFGPNNFQSLDNKVVIEDEVYDKIWFSDEDNSFFNDLKSNNN